jgi:mono/diheme cytochrome c family protein
MFRLPSLLALSLPALAVLMGATLPQAEAQEKTAAILSPTAAQTERGAVLYRLACAMCHGDELKGGSAEALAGADVRATYQVLPPRAIYALIGGLHGHLPPVSKQEALDVTAFILDANGLTLGEELVEEGLDGR